MPPGWHIVDRQIIQAIPQSNGMHYIAYSGCRSNQTNDCGEYLTTCEWVDPSNNQVPAQNPPPPDAPSCQRGSVIDVNSLTLSESIPIVGTPFYLVYRSDRTGSRSADYLISVPLLNSTYDSDISSVTVSVSLAGNVFSQSLSPSPNLTYTHAWDGLNSSSVLVNGRTKATATISQTYTSGATDYPVTYPSYWLGELNNSIFGLGGWSLSNVHFYDFEEKQVYMGDGSTLTAESKLVGGQYLVVSEEGSEVYVFNANGQHQATKNAKTGSTIYTFGYDSQGRILSVTDAYGNVTTINRSSGVPTSIQAPYGQLTTLTLNGSGYLASAVNPNSESYVMTYSGTGGLLASFQKPKGEISYFTYDSDGFLYQDQTDGAFFQYLRSINAAQDTVTTQSTSAEGLVRTYTYQNITDVNGTVQIHTSTDQSQGSPNYNIYEHQSTSYSIANGIVSGSVTYTNDERMSGLYFRRLNDTINKASGSQSTDFAQTINWGSFDGSNPFDYLSSSQTATVNGHAYTSNFDVTTGITTNTSPVGRNRYIASDTYGKPTSTQLASYGPTTIAYDIHGRPQSFSVGTRNTTYGYNTAGYLNSITDGLSQVTSYGYDLAGRLTSITLPDLRVISYGYDADGNITSITPPSSLAHIFAFNDFSLPTSYVPPTVTPSGSTTYAYDNDKRVTLITRPDGQTISLGYDYNGLLSTVTTAAGTYSYGLSYGLLFSVNTPDSFYTTLNYNGTAITGSGTTSSSTGQSFGSMNLTLNSDFVVTNSTVTPGSGATTSSINFGHDNDNLLTSAGNETLTRSSTTGQITNTTLDKIKDVFTYDSTYGEAATYTANYNPSGTTLNLLFSESYTRDALGRISANSQTIGGVAAAYGYTYDSAGRLTAVTHGGSSYSSYTYDANSNATSGSRGGTSFAATFDAQDRLLTYNTKTYGYNANGERTGVVDTSPASTTSYTYDAFGNLKTVTLPSSSVVTYTIDGLFRRMSKKVGSTVKAYWIWDGHHLEAELNSSRVITKRFIYASKSNVPDYAVISGTRYRLISDAIGSVRLVVKSSDGTITQRIDYDEFGKVISDTNPGFQPFGFAGCMYDVDTKLCHFGNREYDSEVGRFLTKDAILFGPRAGVVPGSIVQAILSRTNSGDINANKAIMHAMRIETNLYGYTMNDPVNHVDPRGTDDQDADGGDGGVDADWVQHRLNEMKNDLNAAYKNCNDKLKQITKSAKDDLKDLTNAFDNFNQSVNDDRNQNQTP